MACPNLLDEVEPRCSALRERILTGLDDIRLCRFGGWAGCRVFRILPDLVAPEAPLVPSGAGLVFDVPPSAPAGAA